MIVQIYPVWSSIQLPAGNLCAKRAKCNFWNFECISLLFNNIYDLNYYMNKKQLDVFKFFALPWCEG